MVTNLCALVFQEFAGLLSGASLGEDVCGLLLSQKTGSPVTGTTSIGGWTAHAEVTSRPGQRDQLWPPAFPL